MGVLVISPGALVDTLLSDKRSQLNPESTSGPINRQAVCHVLG